MAGHSKWANIKHRKGRADARKGKIVSKIAKEIITSVKLGGSDPKNNPRLRAALQKARENNVSNDVVERNINKALSQDQEAFSEMTYELYGHGGVGIVVEILTDNKNRIASEIRIATNKKGGTIAQPGSVLFNFDYKGVIKIPKSALNEEELFLKASEAAAEDLLSDEEEDFFWVITPADGLNEVKVALSGLPMEEAELVYLPKTRIECEDAILEANAALIEWLEEIDDVDSVYHNMA